MTSHFGAIMLESATSYILKENFTLRFAIIVFFLFTISLTSLICYQYRKEVKRLFNILLRNITFDAAENIEAKFAHYPSVRKYFEHISEISKREKLSAAHLFKSKGSDDLPLLDAVFIEPSLSREGPSRSLRFQVRDILHDDQVVYSAIIGPAGSGKSTFLKYVRLEACLSFLKVHSSNELHSGSLLRIPIYIPTHLLLSHEAYASIMLQEEIYSDAAARKLIDILRDIYNNTAATPLGSNDESFLYYFDRGSIIFLVDGMDEISHSQFDKFSNLFNNLIEYMESHCKRSNKILLGMRDVFFDTTFIEQRLLASRFIALRMDKFSQSDISTFIANVNSFYGGAHEGKLREIELYITQDKENSEFFTVPLYLSLFVFYHIHDDSVVVFGSRSIFLKSAIVKILMCHGFFGNVSKNSLPDLVFKSRYKALMQISHDLIVNFDNDQLSFLGSRFLDFLKISLEDSLKNCIEGLSGNKPEEFLSREQRSRIEDIKEKMQNYLDTLTVNDQISQIGLLSSLSGSDETGLYTFTHVVFMEVLAADYVAGSNFDAHWSSLVEIYKQSRLYLDLERSKEFFLHLCCLVAHDSNSDISPALRRQRTSKLHQYIKTNYEKDLYYQCKAIFEMELIHSQEYFNAFKRFADFISERYDKTASNAGFSDCLALLAAMSVAEERESSDGYPSWTFREQYEVILKFLFQRQVEIDNTLLIVLASHNPWRTVELANKNGLDLVLRSLMFVIAASINRTFLCSLIKNIVSESDETRKTSIAILAFEAALRNRIIFQELCDMKTQTMPNGVETDYASRWETYFEAGSALRYVARQVFTSSTSEDRADCPIVKELRIVNPMSVFEALKALTKEEYLKYALMLVPMLAVTRYCIERLAAHLPEYANWEAASHVVSTSVNGLCILLLAIFVIYGSLVKVTRNAIEIINRFCVYGDDRSRYASREDYDLVAHLVDKHYIYRPKRRRRLLRVYLMVILSVNKGMRAALCNMYNVRRYGWKYDKLIR